MPRANAKRFHFFWWGDEGRRLFQVSLAGVPVCGGGTYGMDQGLCCCNTVTDVRCRHDHMCYLVIGRPAGAASTNG
jgi:hypothetical protein